MKYNILGRTKLKVSLIGFGGGPLQVVKKLDSINLIIQARKFGINIIDLDKLNVATEKKVGIALQKLRDNMIISTKSFAVTEKEMDKSVLNSLHNLNLSCIDIYQLHMIQNEKDLNKRLKGSLLSLKKAKKEGKIKFIGFSGHHIPTLIKAVKTNEFDTALIPYNLGHNLAEELLDFVKDYHMGVMVMKPLGGGFLVDPKFDDKPFKKEAKHMTVENALKFLIGDKRIHTILTGFQKISEVEEAVGVTNSVEISLKERSALKNRILKFFGDDYCRNCKYCMPCSSNEHIDITEILRLEGYYSKYGYKNIPRYIYNNMDTKADACKQCGVCEKKCPYNIPIRKMLKKAHSTLNLQTLEKKEFQKNEKKELLDLINNFKEELRKKEKEEKQLLILIKKKYKEIRDKQSMIVRRDEELEGERRMIVRKDEELGDKRRVIVRKDKDLKDKQMLFVRKDEELGDKRRVIVRKDKELEEFKQELLKLKSLYKEKEDELNRFYQSKGYRYILASVWKVSNKLSKK